MDINDRFLNPKSVEESKKWQLDGTVSVSFPVISAS